MNWIGAEEIFTRCCHILGWLIASYYGSKYASNGFDRGFWRVLFCINLPLYVGGMVVCLIVLCIGCTGPRYDYNGNGTRPGDKLERWSIRVINKQRPPSVFEHKPEEYK